MQNYFKITSSCGFCKTSREYEAIFSLFFSIASLFSRKISMNVLAGVIAGLSVSSYFFTFLFFEPESSVSLSI